MIDATPARRYAGQDAADRTSRRRLLLIEAALAVSSADGWRQVSAKRVCDEVGLNRRYFYESFEDVDALAGAVVDQVLKGLAIAAVDALEGARDTGLAGMTRATVGALVTFLTDDPARARLLFGDLAAGDTVQAHRRRALRSATDTFAWFARQVREASDVTDPVVEIGANLLIGGTGHTINSWLDGTIEVSKEQLIEDLTALWIVTGEGAAGLAGTRNRG
ncbi:MAG TPA: hypothetical protein VLI04_16535 [Nocardioidaceae bacterium]|nr:hypothetical protein [Nocardioidaceae bacterium]